MSDPLDFTVIMVCNIYTLKVQSVINPSVSVTNLLFTAISKFSLPINSILKVKGAICTSAFWGRPYDPRSNVHGAYEKGMKFVFNYEST